MTLQSRQIRRSRAFFAPILTALAMLAGVMPAMSGDATGSFGPARFDMSRFEATERVAVKSVIDGDTVLLADGRSLRLVALDVPRVPASLAAAATATLAELVRGHGAILGLSGRRSDRYGRVLALVYRDDGLWLQGELLARGLARVEATADNRALVPEMLARENEARAAKRGLWALPAYAVLGPRDALRHLDRFALVEGTVIEVTQSTSRAYLHFGADARAGLTVSISPEAKRLMMKAGAAPESFAGKRVRVRGYVRWWNGPMIDVTFPEQIERVGW